MNHTQIHTLEIRNTLNSLIGEVTAKRLFIGFGLFQNQDMFALYKTGNLYLRAKYDLATELESLGAVSWSIYHPNSKLSANNYYRLPKKITDDAQLYQYFLHRSLEQIQQEKIEIKMQKMNRIRDMANLSCKYERLLFKVNVFTVQDFRMLGAANCYIRLQKKGLVSGLDIFWKFSGALQDKRVEAFTQKEKEELLKSLNVALANAGLKTMTKI